ncbi:hypothetical protein [robinz microvirus RP_188]|nr:hypothetical protein [robinz microvirus RP_188]
MAHVRISHSRNRRPHKMSRRKSHGLYRGTHKSHGKNSRATQRGGFRL